MVSAPAVTYVIAKEDLSSTPRTTRRTRCTRTQKCSTIN